MERIYQTGKFKLNFDTRQGALGVGIILLFVLLPVLILFVFILPAIFEAGNGDWIEGVNKVKKFIGMTPEEFNSFYKNAAITCVAGYLLLIFTRSLVQRIEVTNDSIMGYSSFPKYLSWLPGLKEANVTIKFDEVDKVFSDIFMIKGSEIFITQISSGDRKIRFILGFVGYFDILSVLETRCGQASWDYNTRRIIENNRNGIAVFKTERELQKKTREKFKKAVPSWSKRRQILLKAGAGGKGSFFYKQFFEKTGI